jgi:hypothetical protein
MNYNSKTKPVTTNVKREADKPKYINEAKSFEIVASGLNIINNKSRNVKKNNLLNVKTGIFSSDKIVSTYNKNQLYTHNIVTKKVNLVKTSKQITKSEKKMFPSSVVIASPTISSPTQPLNTEVGKKLVNSKYNVFIKKNFNPGKNSNVKGIWKLFRN